MAYYVVDFEDIENPVEEGLYEYEGGAYVLSEDEEPDPETTYYMYDDYDGDDDEPEYIELDLAVGAPVIGLYEYDDGEYFLTDDTVAVSGKTYYEYFDGNSYESPSEADGYYAVTDGVYDPAGQGLYERATDGSYFQTADSDPDPDKTYYLPTGSLIKSEIDEDVGDPMYDPAYTVIDGVRETELAYADVNAENFVYAHTAFTEDPSAEGLYEIVDGLYVLTSDTSLVKGKTYYELLFYTGYYPANMSGITNPATSLTNYYELSNGQYVLTSDTAVAVGKTYYRSVKDDNEPHLLDPSKGKTPATWDDIPVEGGGQ